MQRGRRQLGQSVKSQARRAAAFELLLTNPGPISSFPDPPLSTYNIFNYHPKKKRSPVGPEIKRDVFLRRAGRVSEFGTRSQFYRRS